ncbi:amidase [Micromonospora sp. NPDC049523]|uniref:amidase n=1 Tax=Micromonospora sp. NPDC049523 TaxID=3155921 RepID=UPI0034355368
MTTWIERFEPSAGAVRVAVKDAIDVAGTVTTAGCAAVRDRATPAVTDAACLTGVRAADAQIVGKTNLTELCLSPVGDNATFGTPVNPLASDRIPGGSSSGSAVAVASAEADVALGTDTGGSVRIPAACCGIVGLKTTWGRIPTDGVWPLAPSLDTIGPLARDVAGVVTGMRLLEPTWTVAAKSARTVGRLRIDGVDPGVEEAVDIALAAAGFTVLDLRLDGWNASHEAFDTIVVGEFWQVHRALLDVDGVSEFANGGLRAGRATSGERLAEARSVQRAWQAELAAALTEVELLVLPTLVAPPPLSTEFAGFPLTALTAPVNLAGLPALTMPVPALVPGEVVPPSLQLIGPAFGEDLLCATALMVESRLHGRR